ncbi:MAG: AI-2E family transporter, partial [Phycisphaerales bacterium]|nr:AI-2E family transporter [Phycisphaerales bacterium]
VRQGGSIAWAMVLEVFAIGMLLFLIPFYFFFFSLWYEHVMEFFDGLIPQRDRGRTRELLGKMDAAVAGFVRGRILIAIIMSAMLVVGYMFVGVPYAILLGILVGFVSIVPYLGLVGIPAAIILLFVGQLEVADADRMAWWGILLWPTVVYTVVGTVDGWVLTPWIGGKTTNLDPVTIFVAILAGGSVLGVYGMLISIPVAACIKILLAEVVVPKLQELGARPKAGRPLT